MNQAENGQQNPPAPGGNAPVAIANAPAAVVNAPPAVQLDQNFINERALHLLLQIPVYRGHPDTRFDEWVRHLDNILAPTNWTEEDKIRALADRLAGSAYDTYTSLRQANDTYEGLKQKIKNRYHGTETHAFYQREFEDRCRKPSETIPDYAYSLKNLHIQAYPHLQNADERFPFLKRAFLKGLSSKLRLALVNFEYNTYEQLVHRANTIDAQQAAEREETSTSMSTFIRAVNSAEPQPAITEQLMASIAQLTTSVAALRVSDEERKKGPMKGHQVRKGNGKNCGYCGKKGHSDERCFSLHPELKNESKGTVCCFCKKAGHIGRNCLYKTNSQGSSSQGNA